MLCRFESDLTHQEKSKPRRENGEASAFMIRGDDSGRRFGRRAGAVSSALADRPAFAHSALLYPERQSLPAHPACRAHHDGEFSVNEPQRFTVRHLSVYKYSEPVD